uniref:Uncharacterized protein n=1 Tax=Setaria italica TaxID=4555 RepID=K3ZFC4_SETIT
MGSVGLEEDAGAVKAAVEAFLERCAPSGDAAYGELRALLARLHDPATRRQARVFLAELRRRQQSSSDDDDSGGFFRRFGFRIQELHKLRCQMSMSSKLMNLTHNSSTVSLHA